MLLNLESVKAQGRLDRNGLPEVNSEEGLQYVFEQVKLATGSEALAHKAQDNAAQAWAVRGTK